MLIILLILFIAGFVFGGVLSMKDGYDSEEAGYALMTVSGILFAICLGFMISAITKTVKLNTIDERIAIYQEENTRIEEQIKTTVELYQEHEENMFGKIDLGEISSENLLLLTSIYPELKSDTLIQAQIQVYVDNTNEIKTIKTQKLNYEVWRWWLCFV